MAAVMLSRTKGFVPFTAGTEGHKPYLMLRQYDEAAFAHFPLTLLEGRLPANGQELLIPETVQQLGNYQPGDTITLTGTKVFDGAACTGRIIGGRRMAQRTESYTITGIVADPRFGRGLPGYTVFTALDAAALQEAEKVNVSLLRHQCQADICAGTGTGRKGRGAELSYNRELLRWSGVSDNRDVTNFKFHNLNYYCFNCSRLRGCFIMPLPFPSTTGKQYGCASVGATPRQLKGSVFYEALLLVR